MAKTSETKIEDAKQPLRDARTEFLAKWRQFKSEAERTIEANEKMVDQLKAKMRTAGPKLTARYSNEVAEFEQKHLALKKEFKDMAGSVSRMDQ